MNNSIIMKRFQSITKLFVLLILDQYIRKLKFFNLINVKANI